MKILFCGDFATAARGQLSIDNETAISKQIVDIIKEHNFSIVNLESPVIETKSTPIIKDGPLLSTCPNTIRYLKNTGFTHITMANNHLCDYGDEGVIQSINNAKENNMEFVGAGLTPEEQKYPLLIDDDNSHVTIFNYCESEFSVDRQIGCNKLDTIKVYYDITEAKSKNRFVIVIIHGGHEGYQLPSPRMKQYYHFLIDCGADVVINHHQHCYSGYESYNSGLIFYGLGNFYFDSFFKKGYIPNGWNEGYMVSLDINNRKLSNFKIVPYIQCKGDESFVRLMNDSEKKVFHDKVNELNIAIQDDKALNEAFNHFAESKYSDVMRNLSPYSNKWMLRFYNRGLLPFNISKQKAAVILNMIRCESHRDVCINILSNKLQYE